MKATFDFKSANDAEDCASMFIAFRWTHTFCADTAKRLIADYEPNTFGQMCGEAGVFAPVQITVE